MMKDEKIVRTVIRAGQQPTEAQIREIEIAASRPVIPDDDTPELTQEQYAEMTEIARRRSAGAENKDNLVFPKKDRWSSLLASLDLFTDDFLSESVEPLPLED